MSILDVIKTDLTHAQWSAGGQVEFPIGDSPWGTYFGMFQDKNGIKWMVSFEPKIPNALGMHAVADRASGH